MNQEPCIKCGATISTKHEVGLRTVMQLAKLPPRSWVEKIIELEGISNQSAQEFVDHKMGHRCLKSEPPCPSCGSLLKTWHATGCQQCGWRRNPNRPLPDYYA